jgi:predicted pyridoxine 5'-phosphate oxidase superfamily flavin-nucleotide-binding protein
MTLKRIHLVIDNIRTFLETPRVAYLSTIDLQGYPHTVPVWFAVDGDDLIFSATKSRARVKHILANPKGAVTIGGNLGDTEGYLIKGEFSTEEDRSHALRNQIIRRYVRDEKAFERLLARMEGEERFIFRLIPMKLIRVR